MVCPDVPEVQEFIEAKHTVLRRVTVALTQVAKTPLNGENAATNLLNGQIGCCLLNNITFYGVYSFFPAAETQ